MPFGSCVLLNLKKKGCFWVRNDTFLHIRHPILNGSKTYFENLSVELKGFRESSASNRNAIAYAVLKLCLVKFEKRFFFKSKNDTFLHNCHLILNRSCTRYKNLFTELENFKKSNASNRKASSCAIWELCLVKFEKRFFFRSKNDTFLYNRHPILNGSSTHFENLSVELKGFKESTAPNRNAIAYAVLKLCLFKFEKRL